MRQFIKIFGHFGIISMALLMQVLMSSFDKLVQCGQIYGGDVDLDFGNAQKMTKISIKFQLQTQLLRDDFLKIVFPFPLHNSLRPSWIYSDYLSVPSGLQVQWCNFDSNNQPVGDTFTGQVFTDAVDSATYYIRLLDVNQLIIPIQSTTWKQLIFTLKDPQAMNNQKSNQLLQISMSTVSSVSANAIIYDENLAFNFFYLNDIPDTQIGVQLVNYDTVNFQKMGLLQTVSIDIDLKALNSVDLNDDLRIVYLLGSSEFKFFGECFSATRYELPIINPILAKYIDCKLDKSMNQINLRLYKGALANQTSIRLQTNIINPSRVIQQINLEVRVLRLYSPLIVAIGQHTAILNTKPINVQDHQIYMAWGLRPDSGLPLDLKIVRGNKLGTYLPMNSFKITFQLDADSPASTELKVNILIGNAEKNAKIILGSITSNLPPCPNKQVVCRENSPNNPSKRKIACYGVCYIKKAINYQVSFKMQFPYSVYEDPLNCSNFGAISIESATYTVDKDVAYLFARSKGYSSAGFQIVDDTIIQDDYKKLMTNLKNFPSVNLLVSAIDFQDFQDEEIYSHSLIYSAPQKAQYSEEFIIPSNPLNFINYANQFSDLYIFKVTFNAASNFINSYDANLIVQKSTPKNILSINTVNGKDWKRTVATDRQVIVSSQNDNQAMTPVAGADLGLKISTVEQRLVWNTKIPLADITTSFTLADVTALPVTSPPIQIPNNAGIVFLFNSKFEPQNIATGDYFETMSLSNQHKSMDVTYTTSTSLNSYNKFTGCKITISQHLGLEQFYNAVNNEQQWGLRPFIIRGFSSVYVDEQVFDIYINTIDGIDGLKNQQKTNSYVLLNAFVIQQEPFVTTVGALNTYWLRATVSNFYADTATSNTGRYIPAVFKIHGKLAAADAALTTRLVIFFDSGSLFYNNKFSNEINCGGNLVNIDVKCRGFETGSNNIYNYLTLSRVEIEIPNYTNEFMLIIPFKTLPNTINLFLGVMTTHSLFTGADNADKIYGQLYNVRNPYSLTFAQTHLLAAPPILYDSQGAITNIINGLQCNSGANCKVGVQQANMLLTTPVNQANIALSPHDTRGLNLNSNMNFNIEFGAAFTYAADFQFYSTNSDIALWEKYIFFRYKYYEYQTDTLLRVNTIRYGVYCSHDGKITAQGTLSNVNLSKWTGRIISGYSAWSYVGGNVATISNNAYQINSYQTITNFKAPTMGPSIKANTLSFTFNAPLDLDSAFFIIIKSTNNVNLPFSTDAGYHQCSLLIKSLNPLENMQSLTQGSICTVSTFTALTYVYQISQIKNIFLQNTELLFNHYLADSPANGNTSTIVIQLSSTAVGADQDLIAQSAGSQFIFDLTLKPTQFILSTFNPVTDNRSIVTSYDFVMSFQSRQMWLGEYYLLNSGQLAAINLSKANQLRCMILESDKTPSHRFEQVQYNSLSDMYFVLKYPVFDMNPSFFVSCKYFIMPSSLTSNTPISMRVEFPQQRSIIDFVNLPFPTFLDIANGSLSASLEKFYSSPGSNIEINFTLASAIVEMNKLSRVIIVFPIYYSPDLGRDGVVNCYLMPAEENVTCFVTEDRTLEVRYFPTTYVVGTTFIIKVTGITQPQVFQQGQFFIAYDNDTNDVSYSEFVFVSDLQLNQGNSNIQDDLKGIIEIRSVSIKSLYLREAGVQYQFNIYINQDADQIVYGQAIMINFPSIYQYVLQQNLTPDCSVTLSNNTLKNYVGACRVSGLRIKMFVNEKMLPGNFYTLTVFTIRNPSRFDSSVYKWIIEVSDVTQKKVVLRSFGMSANFQIDQFIQNPNQNYLDFYDGPNFATANQVTKINMIKGVMSKWLYVAREKFENVWARSFLLTSKSYPISTFEIESYVVVGTQTAQIRVYSPDAIGFYAFQTYKNGDGDYYSDLPILQLTFDDLNLQPFFFNEVTVNVMSSTVQSPLLVTLGCLPPVRYVTVSFSIPATVDNIGLQLIGSSNVAQVNVTNSIQRALLSIQVQDPSKFVAGKSVDIQYTLSGENGSSYVIQGGKLKVVVVTNPSVVQQSLIRLSTTSPTNDVNSKIFEYKCSQIGLFYYYIGFSFSDNPTACNYVEQQIIDYTWQNQIEDNNYNNLYRCQSQFGVINVQQTTNYDSVTINNLLSKRNYIFGGFCQSQRGDQNPTQYISFQAKSNGGLLYKIQFDFQTNPSLEQKVKLACFLSIHFATHPTLVSTIDGIYCSEIAYSRMLKQLEQNEQEENLYHSKKERILDLNQYYLDLKNNKIDLSTCIYDNVIDTSSLSYPVVYYLDNNQYIQTDDLFTRLTTTSQNGCFKDYVTQAVIGIPQLVNIRVATQVLDTPPLLRFDATYNIYLGKTWVYIDSLQLIQNGRFWAILLEDLRASDTATFTLPTATQIRNQLNYDNTAALSSYYFVSDQLNNRVSNITFFGLQNSKKYLMVYVISNEDPFATINYDTVKFISFTTSSDAQNTYATIQIISFISLLIAFIILV